MNDTGNQTGREHIKTNAFHVVGNLEEGWCVIESYSLKLGDNTDWEETHIERLIDQTTFTEWEEITDDEYWGDLLPEWYMNMMTGDGTLDALFGGVENE